VVSRDIKPANVLLIGGTWCLSDFGIGRYVEADTGLFTFKNFGSSPYVAPERWRGETATTQADIYSFGVVTHQMLAGEVPFVGPDFGDQHQFKTPPRLLAVPPKLASLVFECLDKAPEARPTAANILHRLENMGAPGGPGIEALRVANAAEIERRAKVSAFMAAAEAYADRRARLAKSAAERLNTIVQTLGDMIAEEAPGAAITSSGDTAAWARSLGSATIFCGPTLPVRDDVWGRGPGPFDVIAYSSIGVRISEDAWDYNGRVHSLWFCDAVEKGVYRWYETAFFSITGSSTVLPFDLPPGPDAGQALGGVHSRQVAWPFTPVDQGDEAEFLDRWLGWFAAGASDRLTRPSHIPERDPSGSWRRSSE
jgi:serine/threonine-protein kinase